MSIIDWSDPEEMLGLLVDSVRDELMEERSDRERAKFLRSLSDALEALALQSPLPPGRILVRLRIAAAAGPWNFETIPRSSTFATASASSNASWEKGPIGA